MNAEPNANTRAEMDTKPAEIDGHEDEGRDGCESGAKLDTKMRAKVDTKVMHRIYIEPLEIADVEHGHDGRSSGVSCV